MSSLLQLARSRALAVLMLGHFSNDMLGGALPMLFPTIWGAAFAACYGFVTGGVGVPITGRLADLFGMQAALASLTVMLLLGALLALTLPSARERVAEVAFEAAAPGELAAPSGARR